jgi:hypothetical protein
VTAIIKEADATLEATGLSMPDAVTLAEVGTHADLFERPGRRARVGPAFRLAIALPSSRG